MVNVAAGSVAATEQRLQQKMSQASIDGVTLKAERSLQVSCLSVSGLFGCLCCCC